MIRVAFTLVGGSNWTGGYNYLHNLLRALSDHACDMVQPILFVGSETSKIDVAGFEAHAGVVCIQNAMFNDEHKGTRLRQALLTGCDQAAAHVFAENKIHVVFESTQFYGWRFPYPAVAWISDLQHRHLRHLFSFKAYWKREIGFRVQILSGRQIMLSSEDARLDCELFYPSTRGRTHVVRFASPPVDGMDVSTARSVADGYGLPETFFFLPNQFWVHKNHECVIQALRLLEARGVNIVIAVTGKQSDPRNPAHFPKIKRLVESYGLNHAFRLLGLIPHEHVAALSRSCAALINPSTFEGWSTTVEEAKAMGTPMILSSLRVHREQSRDALFFDATSPDQLADIIEHFTPLNSEKRLTLNESSAGVAFARMKRFAEEFSELMNLCAAH